MRARVIKGMVWRDCKIFLASRWRWIEFFYFPVTSLIIWGLFALWMRELTSVAGTVALIVNIFWSYSYVVQSTINLSMNEDAWSGSGALLISSGVTKFEYFFSRVLFGLLISAINLAIMLSVTQLLFFNVAECLHAVMLLAALAAIISVAISGMIAGLIFLLGAGYDWLAWSALQFFVLLSSPLAPLDVLPLEFQRVASIMPYTYLFCAVRSLALGAEWQAYLPRILLDAVAYSITGMLVYSFGFERSRKSGKLAKMF